jgi:hypothetical protein
VLSGHKTGSRPRPFHRRICIPARPPEAAPQWHIKYQKPKTPRFWYTIFGHPGPGRIFAGHPRRNAAAAQNTPPPRALTKYPPLSSYSPFGRAGAFGARWHLHWHASVSSRAVQSRASARSQALDATCVSRKGHQVHGDASFCAERKIPTNIAGTADKSSVSFRRANAQEAKSTSTDKQDTLFRIHDRIQSFSPPLFF